MCRIEHVGIYTDNLERASAFYRDYFGAKVGALYRNPQTGFSSHFLEFEGGARLELMHLAATSETSHSEPRGLPIRSTGSAASVRSHVAFSVGDNEAVTRLTERLREAGYEIRREPRWTGDGYFESVVSDPDGHQLELCAEQRRASFAASE